MKKIVTIFKNFGFQIKADNLNSFASSCAFFIFLSIIPMVMLLFSIIPYTPIDPGLVNKWVLEEFPADTGAVLISILEEVSNRSFGILSVTAIAMLWSAGKGINSLIAGFNAIDGNIDKRNWIVLRLISMIYTLLFLLGIIVVLFFAVGGNFLLDNFMQLFPALAVYVKKLVSFRFLISVLLFSFIFMLCYSLLPYKKHKFRETFPGAIISALFWTGFSYLFSIYVNRFNAFSIYGSLTAIIVLMVWLYFCMYIVFIGDNLNKYFSPVIKVLFTKGVNIEEVKNRLKEIDE